MAAAPVIPIRAGRRSQNKPSRPPHRRTWSAKEGDGRLLRISSDPDRETVTDPDPDPASDTRSESESGSESYSNPDTNPDVALDSDSEGELLRERIAFHKGAGRAKSRRSDWSKKLVAREVEHWQDFCRKIKADPDKTLSKCEAETIKAYLEERVVKFRIKKESSIKAYWKRLSCAYIDLAGHRMDNGTELDIRDWIPTYLTPTYKLDTSEKDKLAMYVQGLYVIIHAHWVEDTKALHGRLRVEISLLLLLSAATTTRPGTLVESGSAKGSNKALSYEHISIMKVRDVKDSNRTTTVAMVSLVHIKNSGGKGRREGKQPIFRNVERTPDGIRVSDSKALPYHKYRDHFVYLGRFAGFEHLLELYQVRRASGRNINSVLTPEERNQPMGHHGSTYEQFYMPDLIERDFQSIYFGTPPQDALIRSAARMGLSRDKRAPRELTEEQKLEVNNDPELVKLRKKRERCKEKIRDRGYYSIEVAKGTHLHTRYEEIKRKINNMTNTLRRKRLDQAILDFHDSIDTIEIDRQLNRISAFGVKRGLSDSGNAGAQKRQRSLKEEFNNTSGVREPQDKTRIITPIKDEDVEIIQTPYPMVFTDPVCLICIGDEQLSKDRQTRPFARKSTLQRHIRIHVQEGRFEREFESMQLASMIRGLQVQEEKDAALDGRKHLLPERVRVIDALFTFAPSSPEEERERRVEAINALVALGHVQEGYRRPVSRQKRLTLSKVPKLPDPLPLECKPT
ncbi:hypothetical protein H2199_008772 [Coniosporium tulheliwenetii]|uniref:Uncharacterized protein n=1 Tax=Coniosporium tulheliwenetii TaxID=3383036 RepID=A0ACC2YHU7_9PEZI|nr:hypothetical protein H2199_008772 [Cladosporium sp. JES 115]